SAMSMRDKMAGDLELTAKLKAGRIAAYVDIGNEDNVRRVNDILTVSSSEQEMLVCVYNDKYGLGLGEYELFTKVARRDHQPRECPSISRVQSNAMKTF